MEKLGPELVQFVLEQARSITRAWYAALGIFDDRGSFTQLFTSGMTAEEAANIGPLPQGRGVLGENRKLREPLRLRRVPDHPASVGFPPNHSPMKSFLGVPLISNGSLVGNLYLTEKQGAEEFSPDDEEAVKGFGALAALAIENDILYTQAREREEALRESEERCRAVMENLAEGIGISVGLTLVYVNAAFLAIHGLHDALQVIGKPVDYLALPEDKASVRERVLARQRGEVRPSTFQYRIQRPDGAVRVLEGSAVVTTYVGQPAALAVIRDITRRTEAEEERTQRTEELWESEERYRAVVENLAEGIAITVGVERVYVNRAYLAIHGLDDVSQALGKPVDHFAIPEDKQGVRERTLARQQGQVLPGMAEYRIRRPGGEIRTLAASAASITYMDQPAVLAVIRDVTARKRAEEQRIRSTRELEETVEQLRTTQQQLIQADRLITIGELASSLAHEVYNPLSAAMAIAQVLQNGDLEVSVKRDVEIVFQEIQRAAEIVHDLLSCARQHEPEIEYVSLNEALEKTMELRAYELRVNRIRVVVELQPDLPRTMADFKQIRQVFLNIINNAEQAMIDAHGGGTLRITTRWAGGTLQVSFADDGPGVPAEHLARVFDPFFTAKAPGKGTGLGLSTCHGIVQQHGGTIRVESEEGKGATFVMELPLVGEEDSPPVHDGGGAQDAGHPLPAGADGGDPAVRPSWGHGPTG